MRSFFVLWSGQTLSRLGSHAVQFALIWWITEQTASATILAAATFVGLLPQVLLGPLVGTLVDRWSRRWVMGVSDAVVAVASLVLAVLFAAGQAGTAHVLGLLFVRALGSTFHGAAMTASTSLMVPEKHLTRIQGMNQGFEGLLLIAGAPLGAMLYGWLSMTGVMLVDVFTALPAIVPLLFIAVPQPDAPREEGSSVLRDLAFGVRYLASRTGHLTLIAVSAVVNLMLVPAFSLLPLFVLERLQGDAGQLGWITSAFGVGMLGGGIVLGSWGGFSRRIVTTLAGILGLGITVLAVAVTPEGSFAWLFAAMLGVGAMVPLVNGPVHAILQATIAPEYQGRVFSLLGSLAAASAPIGLLLAAPVAEWIGVGAWYVGGGIACVAMGITGFLLPALLRIEEREVEAVEPASA